MIGDALGVAPDDHPTLLKWSDDLMRGQGTTDEHLINEMIAAFAGYSEFATGAIEERRGCPRDDLMSILVNSEIEGERLADEEILAESLLILIGGDETTRHVITGGLYQLLANRSQWEMLRNDRSLMSGAVEESLRWVSPIKNMARTATQDVELKGKQIKEGQKLLMLYPSANRDEDHFPDAADLRHHPDPQRPRRVRLRSPLLPRRAARAPRAPGRVRPAPRPPARPPPRRRRRAGVPARELRERLRVDARRVQPHRPPGADELIEPRTVRRAVGDRHRAEPDLLLQRLQVALRACGRSRRTSPSPR